MKSCNPLRAGCFASSGNAKSVSLCSLDDEYGLVVDAIGFLDLLQIFVLFQRVLEDRITNLFCRVIFVLTHHLLIRDRSPSSLPS